MISFIMQSELFMEWQIQLQQVNMIIEMFTFIIIGTITPNQLKDKEVFCNIKNSYENNSCGF